MTWQKLSGSAAERASHGRIVSAPDADQCLDTVQLNQLEQSFRTWAEGSLRPDVRWSRRRIFLIFLLIRYTGAKLSEVLALDPFNDIDPGRQAVFFAPADAEAAACRRQVQISAALCREIESALAEPAFRVALHNLFAIDPGFVRRKFYERAQTCGFAKRLGGPEMIRRARAVELMQGSMPLPAVQMLLGHSTPNLTSAYVSFSEEEIRQVTRLFMERESSRKTSARNSFFGKIRTIKRGDIQSRVELITVSGHSVTTMITNDSLERLGLKEGRLITAEVKAPWVILQKAESVPESSAENRFQGVVVRISQGKLTTEYVIRIDDGTELCAVVSAESSKRLALREEDQVWALFNCFAVVLHID